MKLKATGNFYDKVEGVYRKPEDVFDAKPERGKYLITEGFAKEVKEAEAIPKAKK